MKVYLIAEEQAHDWGPNTHELWVVVAESRERAMELLLERGDLYGEGCGYSLLLGHNPRLRKERFMPFGQGVYWLGAHGFGSPHEFEWEPRWADDGRDV